MSTKNTHPPRGHNAAVWWRDLLRILVGAITVVAVGLVIVFALRPWL